jgi:RNA polymerase-binding transcription factor DksA
MKTTDRNPLELLGREEQEVRRQFSALRRIQQKPFRMVDTPERRRPSFFDAAMGEVIELHRELLWRRLAAHREALSAVQERIREGTYGLCEDCGCRIPRRRLLAMPTATLCVECQGRREATAA